MRQIGTLADEKQIQRLVDYLLTQGIRVQVDQSADGFSIWAIDEDRVPQAREEIQRFLQNPDDEKFVEAGREARRMRDESIRKERERSKNVVNVGQRWSTPRGTPVTILLLACCSIVGIANNFCATVVDPVTNREVDDPITRKFQISRFDRHIRLLPEVFRGEIWRLITPIFLHFGPMHLLMNAIGLYSLGSLIERRWGSWRLANLVFWLALVSNLAQYFGKGPNFVGISGVVFGLFGYVWIRSEFDPTAGFRIPRANVVYMLGFLVLCMVGSLGPIANYAHFGGLIMGMILGYGPILARRIFGR